MPPIAPLPRTERRLMQKTIHKTKDKNHTRRLADMLHRGGHVARMLCSARSSIGRWINWFTLPRAEGLKSLPSGRGRCWAFQHICALLRELVKRSPCDFGYQYSRLSTELLAIKNPWYHWLSATCFSHPAIVTCSRNGMAAEQHQHYVSGTRIRKKKW